MQMKGISTVVATLLMLIITIALAGLAYSYISGIFTARTAVILTIADATCNATYVTAWVRNDGTTSCGTVTVAVDGNTCTISNLGSGQVNYCSAPKPTGSGYKTVRAFGCGSTASGSAYCVS
jgi:flagellin-like protein